MLVLLLAEWLVPLPLLVGAMLALLVCSSHCSLLQLVAGSAQRALVCSLPALVGVPRLVWELVAPGVLAVPDLQVLLLVRLVLEGLVAAVEELHSWPGATPLSPSVTEYTVLFVAAVAQGI